MEDAELIRAVKLFYDDIRRFAYASCKNFFDAEDITQNVFLKLSKYDGVFDNDVHLKNWLVSVTKNESTSLLRSSWKKKVDFYTPEQVRDTNITTTEHPYLKEALLGLKQKYREAIFLFYFEEYNVQEIAEILNIKQNTVLKRLERARLQIKKYIYEKEKNFKSCCLEEVVR